MPVNSREPIKRDALEMWFDITLSALMSSPYWTPEEQEGAQTLTRLFCAHFKIEKPRDLQP